MEATRGCTQSGTLTMGTRGPIVRQGQGPGTGRRRCTPEAGPMPPSSDGAGAGTAVSGRRSQPTGQRGLRPHAGREAPHGPPHGTGRPGHASTWRAAQEWGHPNPTRRKALRGLKTRRETCSGSQVKLNHSSLAALGQMLWSGVVRRSLRTNPQVWQSTGWRCPAQSGLHGRLAGPGTRRGRMKSEKRVSFTER